MDRFEQVLFDALSQVMSQVWDEADAKLADESNRVEME